jgi:hypothetical protein
MRAGVTLAYLAEIRDTDYRTKTFSCCRCGADGALAITEPNKDRDDGLPWRGSLGGRRAAHRLSAKHYGAKAPTR